MLQKDNCKLAMKINSFNVKTSTISIQLNSLKAVKLYKNQRIWIVKLTNIPIRLSSNWEGVRRSNFRLEDQISGQKIKFHLIKSVDQKYFFSVVKSFSTLVSWSKVLFSVNRKIQSTDPCRGQLIEVLLFQLIKSIKRIQKVVIKWP